MRERWGTFSVRDHLTEAPFVTEVLLYDRLVIPVPPIDAQQEPFWREFNPELQAKCLEVLHIKTEETDGLVLTVPWDESKRKRFANKMSVAAALATQQRHPDQQHYVDPFEITRQLIKDEFKPALPQGVSHAWPVAAFSSAKSYEAAVAEGNREFAQRRLAVQIAHQFLTPSSPDAGQELLKRAVDLSMSDAFRQKRANFYQWQESVFDDDLTDDKAIEELEARLKKYNEAIAKAFKDVHIRYAYTVIPIGITLTATILSGALPAIVLAGAAGLIQIARFAKFDRKPKVEAGDLDGAAMIHDAQQVLFKQ